MRVRTSLGSFGSTRALSGKLFLRYRMMRLDSGTAKTPCLMYGSCGRAHVASETVLERDHPDRLIGAHGRVRPSVHCFDRRLI